MIIDEYTLAIFIKEKDIVSETGAYPPNLLQCIGIHYLRHYQVLSIYMMNIFY